MLNDSEGFYIRLEKQLLESSSWPSIYKYKFILKSDKNSIDHLKSIFIDIDANISTKYSSSNKFTSITITANMKSPSFVIEKYKLASKIDGIISL